MKFAMNALPDTFINLFQSAVSLRRIETYLQGAEVTPVAPLDGQPHPIALHSATITWAQDRIVGSGTTPSSTPLYVKLSGNAKDLWANRKPYIVLVIRRPRSQNESKLFIIIV